MIKSFLKLNPRSVRLLRREARRALAEARRELALAAHLPPGAKRTAENTLGPLNRAVMIASEARDAAYLFSMTHSGAKIRKTAEKNVEELSKFFSDLYLRRDIFEAVRSVPEDGLDAEARRFRKKELLDFRLAGVDKSSKIRREIKRLAEKEVKLGQAFERNINNDVRFLDAPKAALDGLPEDYKKFHIPDKRGRVRISTRYPDYFPFMQYAKDGKARRRLMILDNGRGWPKNDRVLRELLAARKRHAQLLGYKTWADYAAADKMIRRAKAAENFLNRAAKLARNPAERDARTLLERKKKDDPTARAVDIWETGYYRNLILKERIGLDSGELRNYFPFEKVKTGVLGTLGKLFGLAYRKTRADVWHDGVEAYDVYRSGKIIGRFYLDLHPRENKYGHAACFPIRPGVRGIQLPEAALVCNFPKGLMSHYEVGVFFHEFGHLMHYILSGGVRWARFNGFGVEMDFVEAPSKMLEEWTLDFDTLKTFACHAKTKKPISRALVRRIRSAEHFGKGIGESRQIFYSMLSLRYHELPHPRRANLRGIMRSLQKKYDVFMYPREAHFYTNFGHLNGYSALYCVYILSQAMAEDILSQFKKYGMRNKQISARYVREVLAPGGSKDARELLRNFLGREWNLDAFRRSLAK